MKQFTLILRAALPLLVLAAFASCSGSFVDPGAMDAGVQHISTDGYGGDGKDLTGLFDDDNDNNEQTSDKPSELSSGASAAAARSKLTEIVNYCTDNPSAKNDDEKRKAEALIATWTATSATWNTTVVGVNVGQTTVIAINDIIKALD